MEKDRTFAEDVKINRFRLELECERHASAYLYWAEERAKAKAEVDRFDDALKLTLAERAIDIRATREANGVKTTEGALEAAVTDDTSVILARKELREARERFYMLDVGVSAMEHRKSQLDNLVQLYRAGYYSTPDGGPRRGPEEDYNDAARKRLNGKEE